MFYSNKYQGSINDNAEMNFLKYFPGDSLRHEVIDACIIVNVSIIYCMQSCIREEVSRFLVCFQFNLIIRHSQEMLGGGFLRHKVNPILQATLSCQLYRFHYLKNVLRYMT